MTYRGSLPSEQVFQGQPEQLYAAPGAGYPLYQETQQQRQQQQQQQPHRQLAPQVQAQQHHALAAPYANGGHGHPQHVFHEAQQQAGFAPQQQQGYGYGGPSGMNDYKAAGYGYPSQVQQQQFQQQQMHQQQLRQQQQQQLHQLQQQQLQQHARFQQPAVGQYVPPSPVWQQPTPPPQHLNQHQLLQSPVQAAQTSHSPRQYHVSSPQARPQQPPQTLPQPLPQSHSHPHPQSQPLPRQRPQTLPQPRPRPQGQHQQHSSPVTATRQPPQAVPRPTAPPKPRPHPSPQTSTVNSAQSQISPQLARPQTLPKREDVQRLQSQNGQTHSPAPQPLQQPRPLQYQQPPPPLGPPQTIPPQLSQQHEQPTQEPLLFVNPQDIQQLPPIPLIDMGRPLNLTKPSNLANGVEKLQDAAPIKKEDASMSARPNSKVSRPKSSPRPSVANSPAVPLRSPSIKKSPATTTKAKAFNTVPMLSAVAEECLEVARAAVHDVAMSLQVEQVEEYRSLIATGLACLEAILQSNRLSPREEARLRLRYAAIVQEETEDLMEAETALTKGISLCDQHRLLDLKYNMQYLMLKTLFIRHRKAALTAVDKHISDTEAFKHIHWHYAFRLLKASFYMEAGSASDTSAFENLRAIQNLAKRRGDKALAVFSSLMEGLCLLKTAKQDNIEKIRDCVAQAAKFQLDPAANILQLELFKMLLDVVSTIHREAPDVTAQKLRQLQKRLDECEEWPSVQSEFLVPIKKQAAAAKTISSDTAAIICPGDADSEFDYLVMSFMTKMELKSIVFTVSGLINMHKWTTAIISRKSTELWQEGLKILDEWDRATLGIPYGPSISLNSAIRQRVWRTEAQAYLSVLLGLMAASHCEWDTVKQMITRLNDVITPSTPSVLRSLSLYLYGVYHQGIGDIQTALQTFLDESFTVVQGVAGVRAGEPELALLASMNRLWIMQHPSCQDDEHTLELIEQLRPLCVSHPNVDLRSAWHNIMAAIVTDPPQLQNEQRKHMNEAMAGVQVTRNVLGAAITLCTMRSRFFENVVGDQALKSALAAARQAHRSGNLLWRSVADGMLAHSYEVQGQRDEASLGWEKATNEAREAFAGSF